MALTQHEERVLSNIDEYGCHIIHVFEENNLPGFTYSVGIEMISKRPELIVTGLNRELAAWMINEYNERLKKGDSFQVDTEYSGFLEDHNVMFKQMSKERYSEYLGWDLWLYRGHEFRALQVIWPSTDGHWPWDTDASTDYKWFLPALYDPSS